MPAYKASKYQYTDAPASTWASKEYQDLTPEKVRDWRRPRGRRAQPTWQEEAKQTWYMPSGNQIASKATSQSKVASPAERDPGQVRGKDLVKMIANMLRDEDMQTRMDAEGFVSIQCLLKAKPALSEHGTAKSLVATIEEQARYVRLDKAARRKVRLENLHEELRAEALLFLRQQPFGVVALGNFLSMPTLVRTAEAKDREGILRQALEHPDSELEVHGTFVSWRPRASKLRQGVEQLFADTQESRLQVKLAQSATGEIPLAWIVGKYADRFGFGNQDARSSEVGAEELAKALADSQVLIVDHRRLTVRVRGRNPEVAPEDVSGAHPEGPAETREVTERKTSTRASTQLRQLLDFYFDPFTLQHNRYLLDLILKRAGPPQEKGPWLPEGRGRAHEALQQVPQKNADVNTCPILLGREVFPSTSELILKFKKIEQSAV